VESEVIWIKKKMVRFEWKFDEWFDRCDRYFNFF